MNAIATNSSDVFEVCLPEHQKFGRTISNNNITDLITLKRPLQESNEQGPSPKRTAVDNIVTEVSANYASAFRLCDDNLDKEVRYKFTYSNLHN